MKLTFLGTGTFFVQENRTSSAYLLEASGKKILVDCGPGTLYRLAQIGFKLTDLDAVFITHFHPDHTSDLFPLFMNFRLFDLFNPGNVPKFPQFFGPESTDKFLSDYSHLCQLPSYDNWKKISITEYCPTLNLAEIVVKPFKVDHRAFGFSANAYSLRFESEGKTVVFSGDCVDCQGVRDASQNADVFVCDTSSPKNEASPAHMDTLEVGDISQASHVKKLILTHFYPQNDHLDLVSQVKE